MAYNYFDSFIRMSEKAKECALFLNKEIKNLDINKLEEKIEEIHMIEHASDEINHEIMENLVKEFLPPIEREDITSLAKKLDNIVDNIEEVLRSIYIFGIDSISEEAIILSDLIITCVDAVNQLLRELKNFKKSKGIKDLIILVNTLEEQGDGLYLDNMRKLYLGDNPIHIIRWSKIYDILEKCLDSCERVVDEIETIILKNS